MLQIHSEQYKNPGSLPPGAVLVVGCGQSGAQIAEDLHLAGRQVVLATGPAPRCARFYRGKDVVTWLAEMGYYEMPVHDHPLREGVRDNTNHYVTGRDGGRDIDLRRFAAEGMQLFGRLVGFDAGTLRFEPNLREHLDEADRIYNGINASIDRWIAERGIDAPPPSRYVPVWEPNAERESLVLAEAGIRHGAVVHRLPSRLRLAARRCVRRARQPRASAWRDHAAGPVLHRPALAAHLGLGALLGRGTRCGVRRGAGRCIDADARDRRNHLGLNDCVVLPPAQEPTIGVVRRPARGAAALRHALGTARRPDAPTAEADKGNLTRD